VAPSKSTEREAREHRDRLRSYNARRTVHAHQHTRRRRDNILAVAAVLVIATLATITQIVYFTSGPGVPVPEPSASASADPTDENVGSVPSPAIAEGRAWTGNLVLNDVDLGIRIDGNLAPQAASAFISLAQAGYYQGNVCHRLTTAEQLGVIQCGQPGGASVDPGFSFGPLENVPADGIYPAGTIAMARAASPSSQSTQFFITHTDSFLDPSGGGYTVFGSVTSGLDQFVADIASAGVAPAADGSTATDGEPAVPTTITRLTLQ
jgi:peptidyl-prolyl cis-trans isomerase B (cyclophilin B)